MKTHSWLFGASLSVLLCGMSLTAGAAPTASSSDEKGAKPATNKAKVKGEEEGPFAPKGKTGRLREDQALASAEGRGDEDETAAAYVGMSEPEGKGDLGLDMVWGFGKLSESAGALGPDVTGYDKVSVATFVVRGEYEVGPDFRLGLQIPFATGTITPPEVETDAKSYSSTSLGNVTLEGIYSMSLGERLRLPIGVALSAPTASGDAFASSNDQGRIWQSAIDAAAQAARGYESDEWFAPHRLGIVPSLGLDFRYGFGRLGAFTRIPFLLRVGGEDTPQSGFKTDPRSQNSMAVEWIVGAKAYYGLVPRVLDVGVRTWITYFLKDTIDEPVSSGAAGPSSMQYVLEPQLVGHFGRVRANAGFLFPIGGRIGTDTIVNGLRVGAVYGF